MSTSISRPRRKGFLQRVHPTGILRHIICKTSRFESKSRFGTVIELLVHELCSRGIMTIKLPAHCSPLVENRRRYQNKGILISIVTSAHLPYISLADWASHGTMHQGNVLPLANRPLHIGPSLPLRDVLNVWTAMTFWRNVIPSIVT